MISSVLARRATAAVAATVLGLSVVATAAPATADSRTLKDGKGDTWNVARAEPRKQAGHPEGDLRKVVIKHSARTLIVSARVQNLKKKGDATGITVEIDTPSDVTYSADAYGLRGQRKGQADLRASDGTTCNPKGSMNYRKDVVTLKVPTRCLSRPAWVRAKILGIHLENEQKAFYDSAHSAKLEPTFTRRIERG